jgi:hypothetical protein
MRKWTFQSDRSRPVFKTKLTLLKLDNPTAINTMVLSHSLRIIALSFNSLKDHKGKVALIKSFLEEIHLMTRWHGPGYTIKYLKACHVALQRVAGGVPLTSLRAIEPSLPFPRLNHQGIPPLIPKDLRDLVLSDPHWMRFWLTLFSLYRVFKSPLKPKLGTITAPFSPYASLPALICLMALWCVGQGYVR